MSGTSATAQEDRRWRVIARGGVSLDEETQLRGLASLGAEVSLRTGSAVVWNPIIGLQVLTVPGREITESDLTAITVDVGLRIQRPLTGAYLDAQVGGFAGANFTPGAGAEPSAGLGLTLGAGWRFDRLEIGAEARGLLPLTSGDSSRLLVAGRAALRF